MIHVVYIYTIQYMMGSQSGELVVEGSSDIQLHRFNFRKGPNRL